MAERKHCARCGRAIRPGREHWLELSFMDGLYRLEGEPALPAAESQGGFPFGPECKNKPNAPFDRKRRERNLGRS